MTSPFARTSTWRMESSSEFSAFPSAQSKKRKRTTVTLLGEKCETQTKKKGTLHVNTSGFTRKWHNDKIREFVLVSVQCGATIRKLHEIY